MKKGTFPNFTTRLNCKGVINWELTNSKILRCDLEFFDKSSLKKVSWKNVRALVNYASRWRQSLDPKLLSNSLLRRITYVVDCKWKSWACTYCWSEQVIYQETSCAWGWNARKWCALQACVTITRVFYVKTRREK